MYTDWVSAYGQSKYFHNARSDRKMHYIGEENKPSILYAIVFDSVLCNKVCNLLDTLGNVASEQGVQKWTRPRVVAKSSHERIY